LQIIVKTFLAKYVNKNIDNTYSFEAMKVKPDALYRFRGYETLEKINK
jgi:hypothetical protein